MMAAWWSCHVPTTHAQWSNRSDQSEWSNKSGPFRQGVAAYMSGSGQRCRREGRAQEAGPPIRPQNLAAGQRDRAYPVHVRPSVACGTPSPYTPRMGRGGAGACIQAARATVSDWCSSCASWCRTAAACPCRPAAVHSSSASPAAVEPARTRLPTCPARGPAHPSRRPGKGRGSGGTAVVLGPARRRLSRPGPACDPTPPAHAALPPYPASASARAASARAASARAASARAAAASTNRARLARRYRPPPCTSRCAAWGGGGAADFAGDEALPRVAGQLAQPHRLLPQALLHPPGPPNPPIPPTTTPTRPNTQAMHPEDARRRQPRLPGGRPPPGPPGPTRPAHSPQPGRGGQQTALRWLGRRAGHLVHVASLRVRDRLPSNRVSRRDSERPETRRLRKDCGRAGQGREGGAGAGLGCGEFRACGRGQGGGHRLATGDQGDTRGMREGVRERKGTAREAQICAHAV